MYAPQALVKGIVSQLLPAARQDLADLDVALRLGRYGELMGVPGLPATKNNLAREGTYWRSGTATLGTGVSYATSVTAFSDTAAGLLYVFNKAGVGDPNAPSIELDYIKLIVTATTAAGTTVQIGGRMDNQARFPTTNNTVAITPTNCNSNVQVSGNRQSVAQVRFQNSSTASAYPAGSAAAWNAFEASLGGLMVVGDEIVVEFGKTDIGAATALTAAQATYPGRKVTNCPSVVIAPGHSLVVNLWFASSGSAPSFSLEMGHFER